MEKTPGQLEIVLQYFGDFSAGEISQLTALGDLYKEWNAKINVISRKDIDSLYEKHVLHSLAIAAAFDFQPGMEAIDIGTGGGFPGIPLAIFFPQTKFHLVDSIGKKIKVASAIAAAIGLTNITTEHIRAEEIKGRKFDIAVSRAVAPLKDLWTWSRPLLRRSGPGLICLKGGNLAEEISASGLHPRIIEINQLFDLDYFREKYILNIPY
ncbi:MAG TPA: 16S rRNA (guanine(527)-N(7))-methyltransferase RsmG [Puia sp.]|nr:16S rRNA (guanine(527)-N(7))-methyltransferase RsmG [Puia sp.]